MSARRQAIKTWRLRRQVPRVNQRNLTHFATDEQMVIKIRDEKLLFFGGFFNIFFFLRVDLC